MAVSDAAAGYRVPNGTHYGFGPQLQTLADSNKPNKSGTQRAGRGYDTFMEQSRNPNDVTMTLPDGSTKFIPAGGPLNQAPQWNQNAGPYGAYLNRLDTNTAAPDALTRQTRGNIAANLADSMGNRVNAPAIVGQAQAGQSRDLQMGAIAGMATAGSPFRDAQGNLLAAGGNAAAIDSARQAGMSAATPFADAGSAPYQGNALDLYQAAAEGRGPSAAQAQLRSGVDQSIAAQRALAAGTRGGSAAAAMRGANQAGAQMNMQAVAQAAQLRAAEQQAGMAGLAGTAAQARAQDLNRFGMGADILNQKRASDAAAIQSLGGLASTGRAQDIGQAGQVLDYLGQLRGQDIQAGGTFGQLAQGQTALDDARRTQAMQLGLEAERQRQAGLAGQNEVNLNAAQLMSGNYLQGRQISLANARAKDAQTMQTIGAITGGAGALGQGFMPYLAGGGAGSAGMGVGPSVDSALTSFDAAHQQPYMF